MIINTARFKNKIGLSVIIALIFLFVPIISVKAAEFPDDEVIEADEVIDDDVFIDGENVIIDGTVNGNLFAMGATVTINGTVNGDAFLFGNEIDVSSMGSINGNLFTGGSVIYVEGDISGSIFGGSSSLVLDNDGEVNRNVFYGGFSLETQSQSNVGRDLYAAAYQIVLNGNVDRDVGVGAAAVELNGEVGRNATLEVEGPDQIPFIWPMPPGTPPMINPGLRIAENAVIGGKLTYTSPVEQNDAIKVQPEGGIVFQTPVPEEVDDKEEKPTKGDETEPSPIVGAILGFFSWLLKIFRNFITLLLLGGLVIWLAPKVLQDSVQKVKDRPLTSTGYGFLTLIFGYAAAFFIAVIILLIGLFFSVITLGGLSRTIFGLGFSSLALMFTFFLLMVSYGSKLIVAYLSGEWIIKQISPNVSTTNLKILGLLIGVTVYVIIRAIPLLGWILGFFVTIIGLGGIFLYVTDRMKSVSSTSEPDTSLSESGEK